MTVSALLAHWRCVVEHEDESARMPPQRVPDLGRSHDLETVSDSSRNLITADRSAFDTGLPLVKGTARMVDANAAERFFAASRSGDVDAATAKLAPDVMTDRIRTFTVQARPMSALMALGARLSGPRP